MARANTARINGDWFQARMFWFRASYLLEPESRIRKVSYEQGPKGLDDIAVEYEPGRELGDHQGHPVRFTYVQCKWHATPGTFGCSDLIDPEFINAERYSLLQRVRDAQGLRAPDGLGCSFALLTNWRVSTDDPLAKLVRKESNTVDLDRLFDGTTDRSQTGRVRKLWREHLDLDDSGLRLVARVLRIVDAPDSLFELRDRLNDRFFAAGMRTVPLSETTFLYDDLIAKLLVQGRVEFDRESFREMCERERLLEATPARAKVLTLGMRSFMHPIDPLEDRCDRLLNLVPHFDGRYARREADWQDRILPELRAFATDEARPVSSLRVVLDAHVSLAVALGSILNVKSGRSIELEQRSPGRQFWSRNDAPLSESSSRFSFESESVRAGERELALAISLTHDVSNSTRGFVLSGLPEVGTIVHCRLTCGPSQQALASGSHAWELAESLVQEVGRLRGSDSPRARLHFFIAGPNAFAFFLGQQQQALGPSTVYEWDFDGQRGGGYRPGIALGS